MNVVPGMSFTFRLRLFWLAAITWFPVLLFAQYYTIGQDPSALKWRQISTPHFSILFPGNFEAKAQQMVPVLDYVYRYDTKSLAFKPKPLPFIIHNYTIVPNAVTVWAPKRVELYTCPPQDSYSEEWLRQLIIHEYRHVVQIDRTNQGFTKVLSWLTGETAAAMVNGLFVPSWFMEGDAVCAETALSQAGRGRVPSFEMPLRAQIIQKGAFSYDKAAFGSYNAFVPNPYVLGYSLVANVRRRYGYQSWITALDVVARRPFIFTPFNNGLKKATGYSKEKLYRITMMDMDSMWKYQDALTIKSPYRQLTVSNNTKYQSHKFPHYLNDTLIVDEYSSMDDITRFMLIGSDGNSRILTTPGFLSSEMFSVVNTAELNPSAASSNNSKASIPNYMLAWTETINDARWEQRNYSVIRIYDGSTSKTRELTPKGRYFSPAFSPDGKCLAAVAVDPASHSSIVLINAVHGLETATLIASDSDFYMTPSWSQDGTMIVFTKLDVRGKSILVFDLKAQSARTLVPATFTEIANPVFAGGFVLFNGSYSGIENVYAADLGNGEIFQVTSAEFGACNARPSPDGKRLVYSNYSSSGYSLAEMDFNVGAWKRLSGIRDLSPSLYKHLVKEETGILDHATADTMSHPSQAYKKAAHLFNFHSWAPAYINYMTGENGTGISFMSQNELSTATTVIGYSYDIYENTGKVTANFTWQGWYPLIDLNTSYGARTSYTGGDSSVRYNFNETVLSGGVTLPLIFTGGKYYKGLQLGLHTSFYNIADNTSPLDEKLAGTIHSLDYSVYAYRYIKQSGKDIYPRWGQTFSGRFRHSPFGDNNLGRIVSAGTRMYFPGLLAHHGIRIDVNWQERNRAEHYLFPTQIILPRGYLSVYDDHIACFALNYKFPFAYPDFSFGPVAYIKRLKANLFYDGGEGVTDGINRKMQSAGIEITSDLHFLRFVFPLDIGFRLGYLPVEKQYFGNLLFSVNLSD